ncbi:helix-turn-helix domain-containing protein [Caulobacter hibisci]|uniref:Helix-turn-helix domain-containing protein n=1 Tax=Caulobacter hibisci TaxID=2035993 RepID=A0ABS0SZM8_9CAUL|nr:helix-turn-helix transcriptional regulator [Caulobacter hibisci]MBI1685069.1 helix-turn-helix domain-containing protein [Caulobacter hibisci]
MPLDTGRVSHLSLVAEGDRDEAAAVASQPSVDHGVDLGEALQAARLFHGMTLQDVADATRIRQAYVEALEAMRLDDLPSRPFTIGYIKAVANLLGLDAEAAVARFKLEAHDEAEPLRAPIGVARQRDPRLGLLLAGGLLVGGAIVLWNVAQRAMTHDTEPKAQVASQAAPTAPAGAAPVQAGGAVSLGAPLPAPVESTTPTPYVTPGLEAAAAAGGSADAVAAAAKARKEAEAQAAPEAIANLGAPFKAKGAMYGAAPVDSSGVILQARKSTSLVVRGADGAVYFTRWLSAGDAFRAPRTPGLVADVAEPGAVDVFTGGVLTGRLSAPQTQLGKLIPAAPAHPATAPAAPAIARPQ